MNILVLGGYGLIGDAIVARLLADGHGVAGLGRDVTGARRSRPAVGWIEADLARLTSAGAWAPLLTGVDVVVNAAGALQDGAGDDLTAVQERAIVALAAAAPAAGVRRIVQISAAGAGAAADTAFLSTKARADAALLASEIDSVVLRPGLVVAATAFGGTALLRALAALPGITPLVFSGSRIRTVASSDVAAAVARAVAGDVPRGSYDLVEEEAHSLADLVALLRARLGGAPTHVFRLPDFIGWAVAAVADALARLGWRSPLRSTALRVIATGIDGDPAPWRALTGRPLASFAETLAALPAGVQERWFGRLWLLKPVMLATLALFWFVSGIVGFIEQAVAAELLTSRGFPAGLALAAVIAGSAVDMILGAALLVRRFARSALLGMLAVTLAYLAGATLFAPDLWLDPLGAMVKAIPAGLLALVALAVLEER